MEEDLEKTILASNHDSSLHDLLQKYGIQSEDHEISPVSCVPKVHNLRFELSDDDDELMVGPKTSPRKEFDEFDALLYAEIPKKRRSKSKSPKSSRVPKASSSEKKEKQKSQRQIEAEQKKIEALKNKEIKKVLSTINKQLKPVECIKFITVLIDEEIINNTTSLITDQLEELGCKFKKQSQLIPNTITWTCKVETCYMDDETGRLQTVESIEETPDVLLILTSHKLLELVKEDKLIVHVKNIQSVYIDKRLSLGVQGLEKHLNSSRFEKRRSGILIRENVMQQLTQVQIFCNCSYRNLDTDADLALMVCQFTKAIAQRNYKSQQEEKNMQTNWYMKGDNRDCVKVDKQGNGLKRLWQQQLTSFPLSRLETAESIIEKYPTVSSLFEGYNNISGDKEKELMLADIAVRRHAGPVTSSRRIGPELSKKIHLFYNSLDGETLLG